MITEVPIFGFMKSRQTFYMLASVLPITHGRSVVNHAGSPATHNLCCVAAADSRNTLQIIAKFNFLFLLSIRALYIPGGAYVFHQEYQEQHEIYIYTYFRDFYSWLDLFVCQVYDSQTAVKHDWSCLSSPGECEN